MILLSLFLLRPLSIGSYAYASPVDAKTENLHSLWAQKSEEELFVQVENFHYSGQFVEAQELLDYLLNNRFSLYAYFLWAQNMEYQRDFELAVDLYQDILKEDIDPDFRMDVYYRLGLAYDDWGKPKKAIKVWRRLLKSKRFPIQHRSAVSLLLGAAYIHSGAYAKGVAIINKELEQATRDQNWMKARARNALAMVLIQQADRLIIRGKDAQETIEKKMEILKQAEAQVITSVELNKSAYVLQGVIQMVDAYLRMYDDARSIPPPQKLRAYAENYYFQTLSQKSKILLLRAEDYAQKGWKYALRTNWQGIEREQIKQRLDALRKEKSRRYISSTTH